MLDLVNCSRTADIVDKKAGMLRDCSGQNTQFGPAVVVVLVEPNISYRTCGPAADHDQLCVVVDGHRSVLHQSSGAWHTSFLRQLGNDLSH